MKSGFSSGNLKSYLTLAMKYFFGLLVLSAISCFIPNHGWAPCTSVSYGYPLPYFTRYCECFLPQTWAWESIGLIANPLIFLGAAFSLASIQRAVKRLV